MPTCADGIANGDEADVDCGGSCPSKCSNGRACSGPSDCAAGQCSGDKCTAPSCDALGLPGLPGLPAQGTPLGVAVADLDGDGSLDAIVAPGPIVFMNDGNGRLGPGKNLNVPAWYLGTGDLDGNGKTDIVAIGQFSSSVLLNQGGGAFTTVSITQPNGSGQTPPAVADVDGDGLLDVVYGTQDSSKSPGFFACVLFNLGGGNFGKRVDLPMPQFALSVALADVNGDGKLDVLGGSSDYNVTTSNVSVFTNLGNREFSAATDYPVPNLPYSMAIGDFDGNGRPDVASVGAGPLAILFDTGGVYGGAVEYYSGPPASGPEYQNLHERVATDDIDGDGKLDLVVSSGSAISVLRNVGGGAFGANTDYLAPIPSTLVLGDLDRDGHPDVVYGAPAGLMTLRNRNGVLVDATEYGMGPGRDSFSGGADAQARLADLDGDGQLDVIGVEAWNEVAVHLRTPGGGFGPRQVYGTAPGARNVVAADLDGDGHPELVVGTQQGTVSILPNVGAGSFGPHRDVVVGTSWTAVAVGDFDGDGAPDLVAGDCDRRTVSVRMNLGALAFSAPVRRDTLSCPRAFATADLDGNGALDLVVANTDGSANGGVGVYLNGGGGNLAAPVAYDSGAETSGVVAADLDGDSDVDVVASSFLGGHLAVFLNRGDGAFEPATNYPAPSSPLEVAAADLDGDGMPDLIAADTYNASSWVGDLGLFRNTGNGKFASAVTLEAAGPAISSVAVGDVDGDRTLDLVVSDLGGIGVHLGHGDSTFENRAYVDLFNFPNHITTGDLDGDGRPEIIAGGGVAEFGTGATIFRNEGGGTFGDRVFLPTTRVPLPVVVADLDGDGVRDLATAESVAASSGQQSGVVGVYLNRGNGAFDASWYYPTNAAPDTRGLAVGDLNGDGLPDIAAGDQYESFLSVFFNQGSGTFGPAANRATAHPSAVGMGDADGNGTLDVFVLNASDAVLANGSYSPGKRVTVFLNDGTGTLTQGLQLTLPNSPQTMVVDDLDATGTPDVVVASINTLSIFLGLGGDQFSTRVDYALTFTPLGIAVADLDGDGAKDVAVTGNSTTTSTVKVFRGIGGGALSPYAEYPTENHPVGITAADLNGDGRVDLATTGYPRIAVLLNQCW